MKWKMFWVKTVCVNFTCDAHRLPGLFSVPCWGPRSRSLYLCGSHPGFSPEAFSPQEAEHDSRQDCSPLDPLQPDWLPLPRTILQVLLLALTRPCAMLRDTQLTPLSSCHKTPRCWSVAQSSQYLGHFELENQWKIMIVSCGHLGCKEVAGWVV